MAKEKSKFQVGQKVKVKESDRIAIEGYSGKSGKVVAYDGGEFPVRVKFVGLPEKLNDTYTFKEAELEGGKEEKAKKA